MTSFVNDVLMPPLGLVIGNVNFSQLKLTLKEAGADGKPVTLNYGAFINAIIDFAIVAFCVFLVVKALNSLNRSMGQPDLYPFVLEPLIVGKLAFVHQRIAAAAGRDTGEISDIAHFKAIVAALRKTAGDPPGT